MFVITRTHAGQEVMIDRFETEEAARTMLQEFWLKYGSWGSLQVEPETAFEARIQERIEKCRVNTSSLRSWVRNVCWGCSVSHKCARSKAK